MTAIDERTIDIAAEAAPEFGDWAAIEPAVEAPAEPADVVDENTEDGYRPVDAMLAPVRSVALLGWAGAILLGVAAGLIPAWLMWSSGSPRRAAGSAAAALSVAAFLFTRH